MWQSSNLIIDLYELEEKYLDLSHFYDLVSEGSSQWPFLLVAFGACGSRPNVVVQLSAKDVMDLLELIST